jgi:hypothetical protein
MRTETTQVGTGRTVVRWRRERLVEAGFPPALAAQLAADARYDTHALIGLVEHGCTPCLAVRILAPLEDGP